MEKYQDPHPNKDVIQQIAGYMRVGADLSLAAAACGVSGKKAAEWWREAEKAAGKGKEGLYLDLYESVRTSVAQAEVIALQRLSAEGGSAGAKWLLEKMNPEKYGAGKRPAAEKEVQKASPSKKPPPRRIDPIDSEVADIFNMKY